MKNLFLFSIISFLFIACNGDDDATTTQEEEPISVSLLGTWLRIAGRANNDNPPLPEDELPFVETESTNTVTIYPDNIISSNGNVLCVNSHLPDNPTSGVYSLIDNTYTSDDCFPFDDYKFAFVQTDSILVISYPYNGISEGKFKKMADLEE